MFRIRYRHIADGESGAVNELTFYSGQSESHVRDLADALRQSDRFGDVQAEREVTETIDL